LREFALLLSREYLKENESKVDPLIKLGQQISEETTDSKSPGGIILLSDSQIYVNDNKSVIARELTDQSTDLLTDFID